MKHIYKLSIDYTNTTVRKLSKLCRKLFTEFENDVCLLATGSLGKFQLTQGSDIDIFCIISDAVKNPDGYKKIMEKKLGETHFLHEFEYYPFESLSKWKWIAQYSTLYCTDLFFARFLFGNKYLFLNLMKWVDTNEIEYKNRKSYVIYNLLYRKNQLRTQRNSLDIKYQPGGLRDYQFLKWVAFRIAQNHSAIPTEYVAALENNNFVSQEECRTVLGYVQSILNYKWYKEKNNSKELEVIFKEYERFRKSIIPIIEKIKIEVLRQLAKDSKPGWGKIVNDAYTNTLQAEEVQTVLESSDDESLLYLATILAEKPEQIEYSIEKNQQYWSVRAAAALNKNTPYPLLKKISSLDFPDMTDIRNFIYKNKNFAA